MTSLTLLLIKLLQTLVLFAATAAFAYGTWHLGPLLRWRISGEIVPGKVVEVGTSTERRQSPGNTRIGAPFHTITLYRPLVEYAFPSDPGTRHRVEAPLTIEGRIAELYEKRASVEVRVDPRDPYQAYLVLPLAAYFWPFVALFAGLAGVLLVGGLFYLPDAAFGRDVSAGVSLLRGVRAWHAGAFVAAVTALFLALRMAAPWLGPHEALAIATGELRHLPGLLKAHGAPSPGAPLNDAEAAVARLPWLGIAYASAAIEGAIGRQSRDDIRRYLDAYAASADRFPIRSDRLLHHAVTHRDLDTFKRLLALGFAPSSDPLFDPLQAATEANLPEFVAALHAAGKGRKSAER